MKKKKVALTILLLVIFSGFKAVAQSNTDAKSTVAVNTQRPKITVSENAVVPKDNTYFFYDEAGTKLLATFKGGQTVSLRKLKKTEGKDVPRMNCAKIPCPPTFGSNVTCWECH